MGLLISESLGSLIEAFTYTQNTPRSIRGCCPSLRSVLDAPDGVRCGGVPRVWVFTCRGVELLVLTCESHTTLHLHLFVWCLERNPC